MNRYTLVMTQSRWLRQLLSVGLLAMLNLPMISQAATDFVVFGQQGVWLKDGSTIVRGDIGANLASSGPFLNEGVEVSIGSHVRVESPAIQVVGNRVAVSHSAQVFAVQANALSGDGEAQGPVTVPLLLPVITNLPSIPEIETTKHEVRVPPLQTRALEAGRYGALIVRAGATLMLRGGIYECASLTVEDNGHLVFEAATELRINHRVRVGSAAHFVPAPASTLTAADVVIVATGVNGHTGAPTDRPHAATFGPNTTLHANVSVPHGTLEVQQNSTVHGALLGKWVIIGPKTSVTLEGGFGLKVALEASQGESSEENPTSRRVTPEESVLKSKIGESATASGLEISAAPTQGTVPLTVTFEHDSSVRLPAYRWQFGDGQVSTEWNPTHTYAKPGIYQTQLSVTQHNGTVTASEGPRITVYPEEGTALLYEPFTDPSLSGWQVSDEGAWQGPSQWIVGEGGLKQMSNIWSPPADPGLLPQHGTFLLYLGGRKWQDYQVTVTMSSTDDDALGLMFRVHDPDNYYRFSWDRERGYRRLVKRVKGEFQALAEDRVPYELGTAYHVQVIAARNLLEVRVNDEVLFGGPVRDGSLSTGSIALYSWYNNGSLFQNLSVNGMEAEVETIETTAKQDEAIHEEDE